VDFELEPQEAAVRAAAREFAETVLAPGARAREAAHDVDHAVFRGLAERGMLAINIPEALGGSAWGPVAYAAAVRELARGDAAVAVTMAVSNMVGEVVNRFGSTEQKQRHLPRLASGEYYGGAFALSEPQAGSDAAALSTKAVRDGDDWVLTGEKMWISTGDRAGVFVVWARTGVAGPKGITCFLVEAGARGLSAGKAEEKLGLRASHTVSLSLDEVRVPDSARLGELGGGFRIAMAALDGGRIGIGAQSVGMGTAALELCRAHLATPAATPAFGAPADASSKLADMATELDAAWLLTLRAAALKKAGKPFSVEAAMAKVSSSEAANRAVREAVQILGPRGLLEESGVPKLVRDCRVTQIYEGTSEIQRLVIGRAVTGPN
jgi:alkylation response protein AidB-like acyl-CoA dehydrogenase